MRKALNTPIGDWSQRRVWIIGASSGIGLETAKLLLEKGAAVAVSARQPEPLQQLQRDYAKALSLPLDITDGAQLEQAMQQLQQHWQGIDLVLLSAGNYQEMPVEKFNLGAIRQLLEVNLLGCYRCLELVLPVLLAQGQGGIAIISSVAGYTGLPKALAYGPSKAALINLCETLYLELHPKNISVYLVNPGFVDTRLTAANHFPMPALISASEAARKLVGGLERGQFHIHFPGRFTNWLRLARLLPYRSYFYLVHKITGY